jgi:hypothetical protein
MSQYQNMKPSVGSRKPPAAVGQWQPGASRFGQTCAKTSVTPGLAADVPRVVVTAKVSPAAKEPSGGVAVGPLDELNAPRVPTFWSVHPEGRLPVLTPMFGLVMTLLPLVAGGAVLVHLHRGVRRTGGAEVDEDGDQLGRVRERHRDGARVDHYEGVATDITHEENSLLSLWIR